MVSLWIRKLHYVNNISAQEKDDTSYDFLWRMEGCACTKQKTQDLE